MRKLNLIAVATGAVLLLSGICSCTKDGADLYNGYYSFKTSGTLNVTREYPDEELESDNTTLPLTAESGQLNILRVNDTDVILAFNILGGDAIVMNGTVNSDNEIELEKSKRIITVKDGAINPQFTVTVSGSGIRYDNVIIFNLTYSGNGSSTLRNYTITASNVQCIAKLNE